MSIFCFILNKFEVAKTLIMTSKKTGFFQEHPDIATSGNTDYYAAAPCCAHGLRAQQEIAEMVQRQVPPRLIYSQGCGAFGLFTVTKNLADYTTAKLFATVGNSCRVFVRFSKQTELDKNCGRPKGFSVRFYTDEGNWDLVAQSSPIYYIKDAGKFPELINAQLPQRKTNLYSAAAEWAFRSENPETLHALLIDFSDDEKSNGYRDMKGHGVHAFAMFNATNEKVWVKYHWKPQQSSANEESDPGRDLTEAIKNEDFPKWKLFIQIMTEQQAEEQRWNPFDATKIWSPNDFPMIEVGELILNQLPGDHLSDVEQAAFSPAKLLPGMAFSPDPLLQCREFAYQNAQQQRVGPHGQLLKVNQGKNIIVSSRSQSGDPLYNAALYGENENDHFTQAGHFYAKMLNTVQREKLAENIIASMQQIEGPRRERIIGRQLCHFFRADIALGIRIAAGLNFNIDENMMTHNTM